MSTAGISLDAPKCSDNHLHFVVLLWEHLDVTRQCAERLNHHHFISYSFGSNFYHCIYICMLLSNFCKLFIFIVMYVVFYVFCVDCVVLCFVFV
jgi:hypothetical protein